MKKNTISSTIGVLTLASLVGAGSLFAQDTPAAPAEAPAAPEAPSLTDAEIKEISSYLVGYQSSSSFAGMGLTADDIDMDQVVKGFSEGLKGGKPSYPEDKIQTAMQTLGERVQERMAKKATENLAAGKEFLEKNGKREGVKTTESGLQYEVLTAGAGEKYKAPADGAPDNGTKFMVNYRGTLIDGTEFDKSAEGEPFPMTLQVIPGFKEALTMMPVGAKWKLFIPSELAYGARQAGAKIAANSTLIFDLELLEIKAAPAPVPATPAPVPVPKKASAVTPPVAVPAAPTKK